MHHISIQRNVTINSVKNGYVMELLLDLKRLRNESKTCLITSNNFNECPVAKPKDPFTKTVKNVCRNPRCVFVYDYIKVFYPEIEPFRLPAVSESGCCAVCSGNIKLSNLKITNKNNVVVNE